jgi:hypothetical protein
LVKYKQTQQLSGNYTSSSQAALSIEFNINNLNVYYTIPSLILQFVITTNSQCFTYNFNWFTHDQPQSIQMHSMPYTSYIMWGCICLILQLGARYYGKRSANTEHRLLTSKQITHQTVNLIRTTFETTTRAIIYKPALSTISIRFYMRAC